MTPNDHMSHDLSYFSGPRTSGAAEGEEKNKGQLWNSGSEMSNVFIHEQQVQKTWEFTEKHILTNIVGCVAGSS